MSLIEVPSLSEHVVLDTDWAGYQRLLKAAGNGPVRISYDRGKLEIMPPSFRHEGNKSSLGMILETLMVELDIDFVAGGQTTFKRRDLDRGFEPDECYWLTNCRAIVGRKRLDLMRDPPPDLIVEVEETRRVIPRLPIFAAFGVPEVWYWTSSQEIKVLLLRPEGEYEEVPASPLFPMVPLSVVAGYERELHNDLANRVMRRFREWIRDKVPRAEP